MISVCFLFSIWLYKYMILKCSHTSANGISVYERMLISSQTLIYVRGTLGIRRVRSEYADIRRCALCYTQRPTYFVGHVQNLSAYANV